MTYQITHSNAPILGLSHSLSGPWTESLMMNVQLDGSGNGISAAFFVLGENVGLSRVDACPTGTSPPCGPDNAVDYTVVTVNTVEIFPIDAGSIIDDNPNPGGGRRVYPDKNSPTDTVDRSWVRVRATITAPFPNIEVGFKAFDLDDPFTDAFPLDTNGSNAQDNRGTPMNGVLRPAGGGAGTSGILVRLTNSSGVAEADFQVTRFPGDNFIVGTAMIDTVINGLTPLGTNLADGSGTPLPTVRAKATQMLTVWRRLHIEVDSMGLVFGNRLSGNIGNVSTPVSQVSRVGLQLDGLEPNRFQGGLLIIIGHGSFSVVSNTGGTVDVNGIVTAPAGTPFILVDDDDFNSDDPQKDGDFAVTQGEDVVEHSATFSLMQENDSPSQNVFAPAYIMPKYDGGGNASNNSGSTLFVLKVLNLDIAVLTQIQQDRQSDGAESDDFWVVYVKVAYQHSRELDRDPDLEGSPDPNWVLGVAFTPEAADSVSQFVNYPRGGEGSLIYLETIRDEGAPLLDARVPPHEVGHQFGLKGDRPGFGIMSVATSAFVETHLNVLRWRVKSPGR